MTGTGVRPGAGAGAGTPSGAAAGTPAGAAAGTPSGAAAGTWPSATTALVGVMGDPIAHSLSPLLHNTAFRALGIDWVSVGFEVGAGGGAAAVAGIVALGLRGMSVTMPLKEEVAAAVDELTPVAARLGAVNCVVVRDGRTVGDSTDGDGLVAACAAGSGFDPSGRSCVVLGAGGAARAVVDALARAGAAEVVVVGRTRARAEVAAAVAGPVGRVGSEPDIAGAELVVHATPVGMGADAGAVPVDPGLFGPGQLVVDLVYHPLQTALLRAAAERGARTATGVGMLVHQAALAIERWTGHVAPVTAMQAAADGATEGGP
ncbi:MAG: shikimate dehydrogenase [Actinomycetota bacterium]|nr:shikimate dehydrogenase [Actinomycetota bacterium]